MAPEFPPIYLLTSHLDSDELHKLEDKLPSLTYDINEASVVVGKITQKNRALMELRRLKMFTEDATAEDSQTSPRVKRRKVVEEAVEDASFTDSILTSDDDVSTVDGELSRGYMCPFINVVRLSWLEDSWEKGSVQPVKDYLIYQGRKVNVKSHSKHPPPPQPTDILERARNDAGGGRTDNYLRHGPLRKGRDSHHAPAFLHQTTTEHDIVEHLPSIPDFLHTTYSCQRPTPKNPPNKAFVEELKKIRTTRTLIGDRIGVRAYSSAIATLSAYPYTLQSATEVERLPGCREKFAMLYLEFKETGLLKEVRDAESDPMLSILRYFYEIWGVAETTAREFYKKGWRDLDDVVEHGWDSLNRVQKIGVKFYDEFLIKIPRAEVEAIGGVVLQHANRIRKGFQMVIVGGYRRGKEESGDVDMILSHPDESVTRNFIDSIVLKLEKEKYITHTLTLSNKNSERGQEPVSWKGNETKGTGFDTMDKALVVWQDPNWTAAEGVTKNPNVHRRVDIIISPWKTVGCAVLGWTSGTTFQRDLRRYCKRERGLKFDSSGIRRRTDGAWVDLEDGGLGPAPDMLTAERRVFAGLGLEWREPEDRNTG